MERLTLELETSDGERACGAILDPAGTFYWQVGPGFSGRLPRLFVRIDCEGRKSRLELDVRVEPF